MATNTYIALIHKDADSDYGASFPDLPGCVAAAETLDEVLSMAKEALTLHIEGMLENGEEIPLPSPAEEIDRDDALLMAAIDVPDTAKVERVNVTVPAIALARIDAFAVRRGMTRSGLFVEAVYRWVMQEGASPRFANAATRIAASAGTFYSRESVVAPGAAEDYTIAALQEALDRREPASAELAQRVERSEEETDDLIGNISRLVRELEVRRRSKAG